MIDDKVKCIWVYVTRCWRLLNGILLAYFCDTFTWDHFFLSLLFRELGFYEQTNELTYFDLIELNSIKLTIDRILSKLKNNVQFHCWRHKMDPETKGSAR